MRRLRLTCALAAIGIVSSGCDRSAPASSAATATPSPVEVTARQQPPDRPDIEITPEHELKRVRHKDAAGRRPLEMIPTPEGTVSVQRTFNDNGELLKEEAFLDGKAVPVPTP